MNNLRRRRSAAHWATLALCAALLGCASAGFPPLVGPPRTQPAERVDRWRQADSSIAQRVAIVLVFHASARAWVE